MMKGVHVYLRELFDVREIATLSSCETFECQLGAVDTYTTPCTVSMSQIDAVGLPK